MGAHKYNPTAIAAKNGEIPPKQKGMSKAERDKLIKAMIYKKTGLNNIYKYFDMERFYD